MISATTSQKIKNMSLLCAAYVVAIHMGLPGGRETSTWLVHQILVEGFARTAVPFFFVVSGFFLSAHFSEEGWWWREVKKRISSLVVPFFIWSLIAVIISVPSSIVADLIAHRPFGTSIYMFHETNWLRIVGIDLTDVPILGALWYVRCLFFFVLLSPFILFLLSKLRIGWLILCFTLHILHSHISSPAVSSFLIRGFSIYGLFYFSVGVFIRQYQNFKMTRKKAFWGAAIGISLLVTKIIFFYNTWRFQILVGKLSVPFLLYVTWHFMSAKSWPLWLTSCAFPIFLMHGLLIYILYRLRIYQEILMWQPMVNFIVGFFGSIIVTNLLRRTIPRLSQILFGGR